MYESMDSMPPGIQDPQAAPNPFHSDRMPQVGMGNLPMLMKLYLTLMKNQASTNPQLERENPFSAPQSGQQSNPQLGPYDPSSMIRQLLGKYF